MIISAGSRNDAAAYGTHALGESMPSRLIEDQLD
jgi:hypothetical protein